LPAAVARLAIEAGLVRPGASTDTVLLPDGSRDELAELAAARSGKDHISDYDRRRIAATEAVQFPVNFLTGGWWEVIIIETARRIGRFRDLRWSAQVGQRGGPDLEEDVLGLDGVELLYISCKRGGQRARLLPLLEELRARAATIGGTFNRRYLAVRQPPKGGVARNLEQRAAELGIRLLLPENLNAADPFA